MLKWLTSKNNLSCTPCSVVHSFQFVLLLSKAPANGCNIAIQQQSTLLHSTCYGNKFHLMPSNMTHHPTWFHSVNMFNMLNSTIQWWTLLKGNVAPACQGPKDDDFYDLQQKDSNKKNFRKLFSGFAQFPGLLWQPWHKDWAGQVPSRVNQSCKGKHDIDA